MKDTHWCAVLLLAGCSAASAVPPSNGGALPTHRGSPTSWTADNLGPQNLLYVSNSNGLVNIYHYWQRTLVGVLTNFTKPMGMCVDAKRNVYITDFTAEAIVEYSHGGSTPIRAIDDSPYGPYGCAVDPATGNLAVANFGEPGQRTSAREAGNVAVYKHATGTPMLFPEDNHVLALSYDDQGDLLAAAYYRYTFSSRTYFYYLPKRGKNLLSMQLPNSQFGPSGLGWPVAQSVNYDGTYWVVTADNTMFRYTIGVKAEEVNSMELTGASGYVGELWLYRKNRKAQATQVVAGDSTYNDANTVDYWKYPVAGDPIASISNNLDGPYGVTVSLRTTK